MDSVLPPCHNSFRSGNRNACIPSIVLPYYYIHFPSFAFSRYLFTKSLKPLYCSLSLTYIRRKHSFLTMANVALNMANENYKYFETNPRPMTATHTIDQHINMDLSITADPSLQAPAFWRTFPHILGFIFIYLFGGMYFNDDIFYYFPIMFFFPSLLFIFICLPYQFMFDTKHIPSFINNLSWGFWFGGISLYITLTTFNHTIPSIMPPAPDQNGQHETHNFFQEQIVFTALCLTSLVEEIVKCYLCHRSFSRFHGLGASTSSINMLLLNCSLNTSGMAIAKGFLALCLIGFVFYFL